MSGSSSTVRKVAVLAAGGGVYGIAGYLTYHYARLNKEASELAMVAQPDSDSGSTADAAGNSSNNSNFSYLTNPLRTQQFQRIASIYDDRIGRDEYFMGILLLRRFLFRTHARGDVLEVGAGTARNLRYYDKNAAIRRVVLSDSSDQMLAQAREKIQNLSSSEETKRRKYALMQADAADLHEKFPDDTFDTVIDTFGLCSYDDPVQVLNEMSRVCRPDGKVLLLEHGRSHDYDFVTKHLDRYAEKHAANWGCVWNRDLDAILRDPDCRLEVDIMRKWHLGTTYYVVCRPRKDQEKEQPDMDERR